ncbi:MAG: hypothetical protein M3493_00870 [Actinomycetota bacterium]|nr:hypothetical protein [Actinomycetota bacterium]
MLDEHAIPGEATVQLLHGHVPLAAGETTWDGATGHLIAGPDASHTPRGARELRRPAELS